MDDLLCKETFNFEISSTSNNHKYYSNIIIEYIKKNLFLKNNETINYILTEICKKINNDITFLKSNILALELLLFHTDLYTCNLVKKAWCKTREHLLKEYNYIKETDTKSLFKFFLLMIHNCPYFLPYDDNVIPGCNRLFEFDKKRKLNKEPYKKYYEYKLNTDDCYNYMRVYNWFNMSKSKHFNCYCENFF